MTRFAGSAPCSISNWKANWRLSRSPTASLNPAPSSPRSPRKCSTSVSTGPFAQIHPHVPNSTRNGARSRRPGPVRKPSKPETEPGPRYDPARSPPGSSPQVTSTGWSIRLRPS
ncbi:hypothetical protein O1L60_36645 [Streptomyces diastatochromogenes]|nr:hypothetical protein [Streptomyces diastatochromogenes]